jgi:nucleotide-binding universal stress UspA family protein
MPDIKRILVPTDFSAPADAALTYALGLASQLGATVSLVHVFDDAMGVHSGGYVPIPPGLQGEIVADLRRRLAEVAARRGHSELNPQVLIGPVARAIVDGARESQADLIVMGTHGRHGMAHLLLGSVAERVVRTATCPVLTVRPPDATAGAAEAAG